MGLLSLIIPKKFNRMPIDLQLAYFGCAYGAAIGIGSILIVAIFKALEINPILGVLVGFGFLMFGLNLTLDTLEDNFVKE